MVEVTTAKEYREKMTKIVTLPSGFNFRIRKMPPLALAKLMSIYDEALPATGRELTPEEEEKMKEIGKRRFAEIIKVVIPDCIVEPKVSLNPSSEDELSLDDLAADDIFKLLDEIMEFSGLGEAAKKARESFRKK
ncbi:MAG: hypothetical protein DRN81_02665 [Thermoproteota archaeon]|nr:MAG: hypothetical protein DRN81_02665 [Candidatus Korarchaeota archaeon]